MCRGTVPLPEEDKAGLAAVSGTEVCHSSKGPAGPCHMIFLLLFGNEVTQMAWPGEKQEGRSCSNSQPLPHLSSGPTYPFSGEFLPCTHSSPVTPGVHSLPPVYSCWARSSLHSYNPKHHHQTRFFVGPVCAIILTSLKHKLTHRALHPGHQPSFSFIGGQGHRRNSPSILLWALHCRDSKQKKDENP